MDSAISAIATAGSCKMCWARNSEPSRHVPDGLAVSVEQQVELAVFGGFLRFVFCVLNEALPTSGG